MDHRHFDALDPEPDNRNSPPPARAAGHRAGGRRLLALVRLLEEAEAGAAPATGETAQARRQPAPHEAPGQGEAAASRPPVRRSPLAQTCARTCGTVMNNCETPVNCGSCAEPTCAVRLTWMTRRATVRLIPISRATPAASWDRSVGRRRPAAARRRVARSAAPARKTGSARLVCDGCRDGVTCHLGNTPEACGEGGVTCEACATGELCSAGACDWAEGYEEINGGEFRICNRFVCSTGCICTGNLGVNYVCANSASAPCTGHADCPAGQGCRWGTCYESC